MNFERIAAEQYDSIPDIPEPAEHAHLFGHRKESDALVQAYRSDKFHHALMLVGPRGIGKATLAFRMAYHVLAHPEPLEAPSSLVAPDPSATLFRLMAQGAHPSLLHLTRPRVERGSGFKSAVTVDEVRRVGRFLSMTSHDGGYRIVIVDAADDMNRNAANALLKNLEEPPPRTLFILIVHSLGRMLPTIRSRCQLVKLKPLENDDVLKALAAISPGEASASADHEALLAKSGGSVRNALLMAHFGGFDITNAIDEILARPRLDVAAAYRVADAVAGRDAAIPFQLFNDHVMAVVEARARGAGEANDAESAARLAARWSDIRQQISDAQTYNLDKRQHVVGLLGRLVDAP